MTNDQYRPKDSPNIRKLNSHQWSLYTPVNPPPYIYTYIYMYIDDGLNQKNAIQVRINDFSLIYKFRDEFIGFCQFNWEKGPIGQLLRSHGSVVISSTRQLSPIIPACRSTAVIIQFTILSEIKKNIQINFFILIKLVNTFVGWRRRDCWY